VIGAPTSNAVVTSPLHLSGSSVAYEGVVNVSLRVSGRATPLVTSTVMGGGSQLSPFKGTIRFAGTHGQRGVLVLTELSAKDGSVICATVVPVRFG